jgi:hypothetical protein
VNYYTSIADARRTHYIFTAVVLAL